MDMPLALAGDQGSSMKFLDVELTTDSDTRKITFTLHGKTRSDGVSFASLRTPIIKSVGFSEGGTEFGQQDDPKRASQNKVCWFKISLRFVGGNRRWIVACSILRWIPMALRRS